MQELDVSAEKLEKLRVEYYCFDCNKSARTRAKIEAPSLETIVWLSSIVTGECVVGKFDWLNEAVLGSFLRLQNPSASKTLSKFLTGVSQCRCLSLKYPEIPTGEDGFAGIVFDRLKSLTIRTSLDRTSIPVLASLFRISPTVHTISILNQWYAFSKPNSGRNSEYLRKSAISVAQRFWEPQAQSMDSFFRNLKSVEIRGSSNLANSVGLVKFLLEHGKVLQQLSLLGDGYSKLDLSREIKSVITGFSRASSDAQIIFQGS